MTRAKNQINFTKKALAALPAAGEGKRSVYFDNQVKGLNLIVTDKGAKNFYLRRVIDKRNCRIRIGPFPDLSIENARSRAIDMNAAIARGENPYELDKRSKAEPDLAAFFNSYIQKHAKPHKRSYKADQRLYELHIANALGSWKLSKITKEQIANLHHKIASDSGKYAANRVLALIRGVLNRAIEWGVLNNANPATHIKAFREESRDRFLQKDELPRFFKSLEEEPNGAIRDYVWLSLLTGARKANILSMKWKDLNLDEAQWRIQETKNGTPQLVPLIAPALDILRTRRKLVGTDATFVFPSHGKTGHMVEPKKGWKRILDRAEITDLRIHDLRRTMGSYQAILGASFGVIGKSLGHKSLSATQIYARLDMDPIRQSMSNAAALMLNLGEMDHDKAE